jgi:transcriptional regulator with XRE-family HTH domain
MGDRSVSRRKTEPERAGPTDRGAKLDRLIQSCGLSQKALAMAIGVDPSRLSEWRVGRWRMPLELGVRLAKVLGVTAEYLVDDAEDGLPPRIDEEALYLLRIIADAGLTPGEVAKDVLRNVRWARTRRGEHFDPTELEILDLSPTASDPDATAPQARVPGKPQTG